MSTQQTTTVQLARVTIHTSGGAVHEFETVCGTCLTCGRPRAAHPVTINREPATLLAVLPDSLTVGYPGAPGLHTVPHDAIDEPLCHDDIRARCSCRGGEPDDDDHGDKDDG